jgi:hypothetical protein
LPRCATCRAEAPKARTKFTLIDGGWRVIELPNPAGVSALQWYCPECWGHRRKTTERIRQSVPPADDAD